ncbi:acyl carrier protein [Aerosakkonema funiforme]|uniref:Acyl carrier protein n=1 Tax=Aerosakkonema funiforme FACHB-1375 TaxID=2949571 RepID=A0A926VED4_9CYAN|nr:acyl carrier protein [Aerosakkonema funiforme]MBD2182055.1 acyl carrier protein [Aerosakkonema funiforme FACHB-1375]
MKSVEFIKAETKKVLLEILPNVNPETLSDESNIFSLGLGSVDAMMLVDKLETTFDIKFLNSEINFDVFQNLASLIELIEKKYSHSHFSEN